MPSTDIAFSPAVKSVQERRGRLRSHHIAVGMTKNEQDLLRITWQMQKFPGYSDQLTRHSKRSGISSEASLFSLRKRKPKVSQAVCACFMSDESPPMDAWPVRLRHQRQFVQPFLSP